MGPALGGPPGQEEATEEVAVMEEEVVLHLGLLVHRQQGVRIVLRRATSKCNVKS